MKPKGKMATMRTDVIRNRKMVHCENSSWIGFSRSDLRYGDFFLTNENRLGRCHGQVRASFMSKGPIKSWPLSLIHISGGPDDEQDDPYSRASDPLPRHDAA